MLNTASPDDLLSTLSGLKWKKIGSSKRAGVLVPLFSIYSKESQGMGDLADLKLLVDWAHLTGNSILQLLPMNDMGPLFCPYDSHSSFAMEPAYICLKDFAVNTKDLTARFPAGRAYVNYSIKEEKIRLLRDVYLREKDKLKQSLEFKKFQEKNAYWLLDFALYKVLKDRHEGRPWYDWPHPFRNRDKLAIEKFKKEQPIEMTFQMWMQWLIHKQFKEAKTYAKAKKVLIKGDLPILVSRDSADVWQHPGYFKLDFAAGAPPDMYCARGQRWGMPPNDWEKISTDGFRYVKERLRYAQEFYDILRIDHVAGLFRIWSIPCNEPQENKGLNGFFDPQDEKKGEEQGRRILKVILDNTDMLLCAEDLGTIPAACPAALKEFGIPGNDVQRWTKDWWKRHDFLEPHEYRALSVAMLSTHDTTNWPAWWENEAGTVDGELFMRKCSDHRKIDFSRVKDKLFDVRRSHHGRLRWKEGIDSAHKLVAVLGKRKEELGDFIDMYKNSHREKEKLWKHLKLKGAMQEKSDAAIVREALQITLGSSAIFCINTLVDWLYIADVFKGDPYQNRINTPGTISDKNWSLTIPLSLEELLKHKVNKTIRKMIESSGRI
jgi:4-alpha-glucanotransferase